MTDIPKKTDHTHDLVREWTDNELLTHVRDEHEEGPPYLYNESNRVLLLQRHQQAHQADPVSMDMLMPPGWRTP